MTLQHPGIHWRAGIGSVAAAAAFGLLLLLGPGQAYGAESPVELNTAAGFSVLAGTAVSNTGATTLAQDLGVHPGGRGLGIPARNRDR